MKNRPRNKHHEARILSNCNQKEKKGRNDTEFSSRVQKKIVLDRSRVIKECLPNVSVNSWSDLHRSRNDKIMGKQRNYS